MAENRQDISGAKFTIKIPKQIETPEASIINTYKLQKRNMPIDAANVTQRAI